MSSNTTCDTNYPAVSDAGAARRVVEFYQHTGIHTQSASAWAVVIWPGRRWRSQQGAGAACTRVLKRIGAYKAMHRPNGSRGGWRVISVKSRAG